MPEKKRTKAKGRLRFFVGQAATAAQRIAYVIRCLAYFTIYVFLILFLLLLIQNPDLYEILEYYFE
ncbi:hypothetical protein AGMMS49587_10320 [Spirochaetia bacterium]|nr:hypothetical protein AGMMS49587_10320 [Spirochaetia bacterium]